MKNYLICFLAGVVFFPICLTSSWWMKGILIAAVISFFLKSGNGLFNNPSQPQK